MSAKIMIVDDDEAIGQMLTLILSHEGFETCVVTNGHQVMEVLERERPHLMLLDVMLPGKNGVEVCTEIRKKNMIPIIMLTAKSDTVDIVQGLESGADDYIVKPFKNKELIARIKTRLRTTTATHAEVITVGDLDIDVQAHEVRREDDVVPLTPLEFDLLLYLAKKPGQVVSREDMMADIWGYQNPSDTRLVNVHIQRLRSKVEHDVENPTIVQTVRGVGYKLVNSSEG